MNETRLFDYIHNQYDNDPIDKAFGKKVDGKWIFYGSEEIISRSRKLASGLLGLGIRPGDKVSIVAYKNRPEWIVADIATLLIGVINVPLYPTISSDDYEYIMKEAEVKACFVGDGDLFTKVSKAKINVPTLGHILSFDKSNEGVYWEDIYSETNLDEVQRISETIKSEDLATIIYTSGTTGNPKGVMLSHKNIISVVGVTLEQLPIFRNAKVLSFLPFCHIFERAVIYGYTEKSVQVHCTGTDNLGGESGDLMDVKPDFFTTVPRLLEKVYEKIFNKGLQLTGLKRSLFFWALSLTKDFDYDKNYRGLEAIKRAIADKLIFSKWRAALGGNLKGIVTGAAPCPSNIARVFSAAGIEILEGYGLTETSPTLTLNRYNGKGAKIGTVGPVISGVNVIIDTSDGTYETGEGEILASGDNIMLGYYKKPNETAAVFKEVDGIRYFMTGDIGKFVDGHLGLKYLKITDRKKELLKTSGGKYVAPAPIENKFKEDFLVEQIMVVGDKQKFVSALIVPAVEPLKGWCKMNGVSWSDLGTVLKNTKVIARYQKCCDKLNPQFSHIEQIKKFTLLNASWEANRSDGTQAELTPTMKLKRRIIRQKFESDINLIYGEE